MESGKEPFPPLSPEVPHLEKQDNGYFLGGDEVEVRAYSQSALFGAGSKYCSHTQLRHFLETLVPLLQKVQPEDLRGGSRSFVEWHQLQSSSREVLGLFS